MPARCQSGDPPASCEYFSSRSGSRRTRRRSCRTPCAPCRPRVPSPRRDQPSALGPARPPRRCRPSGTAPRTLPRSAGSTLSHVAAGHHRRPSVCDALPTLTAVTVSVLSAPRSDRGNSSPAPGTTFVSAPVAAPSSACLCRPPLPQQHPPSA